MATLFMETTAVSPARSAEEIIKLLVANGATSIMQDYEGGRITGLSFQFVINEQKQPFSLPVRVEPVHRLLMKKKRRVDRAMAERIAWRQLYRWVQAQVAMIQCGMAETAEVFAPYWLVEGKTTLYQALQNRKFQLALPAPEKGK